MPDSKPYPSRVVIEILTSLDGSEPWTAIARWETRSGLATEIAFGGSPEIALSRVQTLIRNTRHGG